jgi:ribonuclease T2
MMQRHYYAASLLALIAGVALVAGAHAAARNGHDHGTHFDYYVMSLSWSPSYCLTHRDEPDQCGRHGFGFVLHGLWPQYRKGGWRQHCGTRTAPDAETVARTLAFMPSRRLIEHEWQAHGSCTGMDPRAYFDTADRAFSGIAIPKSLRTPQSPPALSAADIEHAFARANPGLDASMLSVVCHDGGELAEVRVCLGKDTLAPQSCGGRVRNSCRYGKLRIPAAR